MRIFRQSSRAWKALSLGRWGCSQCASDQQSDRKVKSKTVHFIPFPRRARDDARIERRSQCPLQSRARRGLRGIWRRLQSHTDSLHTLWQRRVELLRSAQGYVRGLPGSYLRRCTPVCSLLHRKFLLAAHYPPVPLHAPVAVRMHLALVRYTTSIEQCHLLGQLKPFKLLVGC